MKLGALFAVFVNMKKDCLIRKKSLNITNTECSHTERLKQRERLFTDNMIVRYYCIIALFLISPLNCHEGNTTNVFDIRDEQHIIIKYTVVAITLFFVLYGIISNILMITVCYSRNNLYSRPFILIVSQIIISNLVSFIPYVIILLPGILLNKKYGNLQNGVDERRILQGPYIFIYHYGIFFIFVDAESLHSHNFTKVQRIFPFNKAVCITSSHVVDIFWYDILNFAQSFK
ncbi:unnamed protein product [Brugia pahangi]|uniref:G_PROTEIN_RECEP_F1_2 domain-containing protein n=1 Tax=Brugia pahangi TaxID=6280 RepID=A0A0N4TU91_BRUPA|nr:unnamed protein product [Brugia pahangi]